MWVLAGLVVAVLGLGELEHWRASKRRLGHGPPSSADRDRDGRPGQEAVVVLGYFNPGPRINMVNRWRVRAGLRSLSGPRSRLILSGGSATAGPSEAELMASYAREVHGYRGPLQLETTSRSTWQNVQNVIPLLEDADTIKFASHSLHAEKARAYLWKLRPDLATRLVQAHDYRFGEWLLAKPALTVLGRRNLHRIDRREVHADR